MRPEDDFHSISTAMPAPAARSRGGELGTVVNYPVFTCDGLRRHRSLLAFSVETKRSTRRPTAFACLWREVRANISTTDTSSLGNHLWAQNTGCVRFACLPEVACWFRARPLSQHHPLCLPLHLARSSRSRTLFVLRMCDVVRIQHLV